MVDLTQTTPIAFQEFMIVPVGAPTFKEALRWGAEIFHALKKILKARGLETSVGDEGGFAPRFEGTEDGVETILKAIEAAGYEAGENGVMIGFDCASSEFYEDGVYNYAKFEGEGGAKRTAAEQIDYLEELVNKYPIITIEDGMDENDWDGWKALTRTYWVTKFNSLVTTSSLQTLLTWHVGIEEEAANAILIKVNQIGTLTETFEAIEMAKEAGYTASRFSPFR